VQTHCKSFVLSNNLITVKIQ